MNRSTPEQKARTRVIGAIAVLGLVLLGYAFENASRDEAVPFGPHDIKRSLAEVLQRNGTMCFVLRGDAVDVEGFDTGFGSFVVVKRASNKDGCPEGTTGFIRDPDSFGQAGSVDREALEARAALDAAFAKQPIH